MEWENKVKMIQLGNQRYNSEEAKKEFQNFVLENMSSFDGQSWDMFCNLVDLIIEEMKQDFDFWEQVYQKIKNVDCNDKKFGLRSGMRIAMIQTICEDEFKLTKNETNNFYSIRLNAITIGLQRGETDL